jgi:hypothetical protein
MRLWRDIGVTASATHLFVVVGAIGMLSTFQLSATEFSSQIQLQLSLQVV